MLHDYYPPQQVFHAVCCNRIFHVVAMPGQADEHIAWCLEFPSMTCTGATRDAAIRELMEQIEASSRAEH